MRRSFWLVFLLAIWGVICFVSGAAGMNSVLMAVGVVDLSVSSLSVSLITLACRYRYTTPDPVKPKPSLQVPAPFGAGPVDWNSLAALELAMYGQRFPARLYRRRPDVLIFSERNARQWITGRMTLDIPRDEMVFASEPGIDPEDDEWWKLFRLPGYSAPDAAKPTSSSTERSSGAPSASTSALAANNTRTLTAKDMAAIWPEAIIPGNEHMRAMPVREYARYFPNAVWTPSEHAMQRLENHVGTSSRNLRLPGDAFSAKDEGDSTRSLFNRLLREAAQIGQMLESMERGGSCGTTMHADAVREQRRIISQAKSLFPALAEEDRKRGTMILPDGAEVTPLSITAKSLPDDQGVLDSSPYCAQIASPGGSLSSGPYPPRPPGEKPNIPDHIAYGRLLTVEQATDHGRVKTIYHYENGKTWTHYGTPSPPYDQQFPASRDIITYPDLTSMIPSRGRATTTMNQRAVDAARGREFLGATKSYSTCEDRLEIYWKIVKGEL